MLITLLHTIMEKHKHLVPGLLVVIALLFIVAGYIVGGKSAMVAGARKGETISQDIIFLTGPVKNFSGTVEKVGSNNIIVSRQVRLSQENVSMEAPPPGTAEQPAAPLATPTPIVRKLSYTVKITQKTEISMPPLYIPYLIKKEEPLPQAKLTIKDVKVGQVVQINTNADLRTLKTAEFEATTLNLPGINNFMNGKVVTVKGDTVTVRGIPSSNEPMMMEDMGQPNQRKEQDYTFTITGDTEISANAPMPMAGPETKPGEPMPTPKIDKFAISDLKAEMQVTVYTNTDILPNTKLVAFRIQPNLPPPTAAQPKETSPPAGGPEAPPEAPAEATSSTAR